MPINGLKLHAQQFDAQGEQTFEPQRGNNAIIRFEDIPEQEGGDMGTLELALQTLPAPNSSHNSVERHFLNEVRKFAGKRTYDDQEIEYADIVSPDIARKLYLWYGLVYNPGGDDVANGIDGAPEKAGGIGLAKNYKKRGRFFAFGPDGTGQREWELIGCWPMSLNTPDFDMTSDEPVNISATISIDKVRYVGNSGGGSAS